MIKLATLKQWINNKNKKLLLILLCLPFMGFGQQTYVPNDDFEQVLINLGYAIV